MSNRIRVSKRFAASVRILGKNRSRIRGKATGAQRGTSVFPSPGYTEVRRVINRTGRFPVAFGILKGEDRRCRLTILALLLLSEEKEERYSSGILYRPTKLDLRVIALCEMSLLG